MTDSLNHLYKSFTKLRKTRWWKEHVTGGAAFLEVTYRPERNRWHPHFHLIVSGKYIPHNELRTRWLQSTGDSFICDIRSVRDHEDTIRYVTAYVTKSIGKRVWSDPDRLSEAIYSLHGRKLCFTFGSWVRLKLLSTPQEDGSWETVCSADTLLRSALAGDRECKRIAHQLWKRLFVDYLKEHPP